MGGGGSPVEMETSEVLIELSRLASDEMELDGGCQMRELSGPAEAGKELRLGRWPLANAALPGSAPSDSPN